MSVPLRAPLKRKSYQRLMDERGGANQLLIMALAIGFVVLALLFLDLISVFPVRRIASTATDAGAHAGAVAIAEELNRADRGARHPPEISVTPCTFTPQPFIDVLAMRYLGIVTSAGSRGIQEAAEYTSRNKATLLGNPSVTIATDWEESIRGSTGIPVPGWRVSVRAKKQAPSIVGSEQTDVKARAEAIAYPVPGEVYISSRIVSSCGEYGNIYELKLYAEWRVTISE